MSRQENFRNRVMSEMLESIKYICSIENYATMNFITFTVNLENTDIKFDLRYRIRRKYNSISYLSDNWEKDFLLYYYQFVTYYINNYGMTAKEVDLMWEEFSKRMDDFVYDYSRENIFLTSISFSYPEFPNVEHIHNILKVCDWTNIKQ